MGYSSQYGQDAYVDKLLKGKRNGVFVELGANDGITECDTLFFEQERDWKGICIEPREHAFEILVKNRKCICENVCVGTEKGEILEFWEIQGYGKGCSGIISYFSTAMLARAKHYERSHPGTRHKIRTYFAVTVMDLLEKHKITNVDYFSLDINGGELKILESIDFDKVDIDIFSIENEYGDLELIRKFMADIGYENLCRMEIDDIFRKKR